MTAAKMHHQFIFHNEWRNRLQAALRGEMRGGGHPNLAIPDLPMYLICKAEESNNMILDLENEVIDLKKKNESLNRELQ